MVYKEPTALKGGHRVEINSTGANVPFVIENGFPGQLVRGRWMPLVAGGDGTDGDNTPEGGTGSDNSGGTGTGDNSGEGPKFTQEQLDAIVAREKNKAARGKIDPKEFGFDSQKDLKEFLEAAKEQQKQSQSDAEKAIEEAKKQAAEEAETKVLSKANARLVKEEFKIAALDHGVKFMDDAYALAQTLEDWDVEVDDEGVVTGLTKEFFEELKKQKPFLFQEGQGDNNDGSGNPAKHRKDVGAGAGGSGGPVNNEAELKENYPALQHIR
jgi:hypothetical protein